MDGNIAATYTLIYQFLTRQSQAKAADAVKKAARPFVALRDGIELQGLPLEDIVKEWNAKKNMKHESTDDSSDDSSTSDDSDDSDTSGSDSSSEDISGSNSDSDGTSGGDDSSDDSDEGEEQQKATPTALKAVERDTSITLSSEENSQATKQMVQIPNSRAKNSDRVTNDQSKGSDAEGSDSDSESDSSDSDSSSDDSASDGAKAESSISNSSSFKGSVSDEKAIPKSRTKTKDESTSSSEPSSESDGESEPEPVPAPAQQNQHIHVAKKRKISEGQAAAVTPVPISQRLPRNGRERFQRVKVHNIVPEQLLDNGYKAKGGLANDYGERAHRDLIVTRGVGFRKEKNKKKRGSYRGGEITMESHSIKFDF